MKPLENELRRSLRRINPPAGFTDRVMSGVEQGRLRRPKGSWRSLFSAWTGPRLSWSVAAVAAVVILAVSAVAWHQRRAREQQQRGELARAQVIEALRITSVKLNRVRSRVREASQDGTRAPDRGKANRTSLSVPLEHIAVLCRDLSVRT